ncbi:HEAT repeat-containing protein 5B-like [Styela clava]
MELAHGLLLNEEALSQVPKNKKTIFVYEWLRFLEKVLGAAQKADIKEKQPKLIEQLLSQLLSGPGPPTRHLIGRCLTILYTVGDTYSSYETVSKCNEVIRSRDDSPSYLPTRLAAIECLGCLYEKNGRMLGGLLQDTVSVLVKGLKNAESQARAETMLTLKKILIGLESSASICHRDIYKATKLGLIDRSMYVRTSAAECMRELAREASFLYSTEFEQLAQQCFRALEGTTYEARSAIARLLGFVMAGSQRPKPTVLKGRKPTLDEVLNTLANGFVQGGPAGKTSGGRDSMKNGINTARAVRIGVTEAYVEMALSLGPTWLERNLSLFLKKVLDLVSHPKSIPSHVEAVYSRRCVVFILRSTVGRMFGEKQQRKAAKELCNAITEQMNQVGIALTDTGGNNPSSMDISPSQHMLVCATHELGCLVKSLGTSAAPLVAEPASSIIEPVVSILLHPSQAARLAASWCLRCIASAIPSQLCPLIDRCADRIRALKSSGEAVSGFSSALAALLGAVCESPMGIPHSKGKVIFAVAEELLRSAAQNTTLTLFRTQAGWLLAGALMTLGPAIVRHHLTKLLLLWKTAFPRSMRELDQERQRGDAFTWQLTLEARSGALCAMRSFVANCGELLTEEVTRKLMIPLESAMAMMSMIPFVVNTHGLHLKASAAMVRLRLYDILALLPPKTYEGSFHALLRELVAEFTLTDNPANTTTSLLRSLCHSEDSVLLGSWLKDTDQSLIEEQLQGNSASGSGALEHDPTAVYLHSTQSNAVPGPLPLGVSVIDAAIALFGLAFPHVAAKHRLQMLRHFAECVKQANKNLVRQRAIQINVFTALICALKGLGENKRQLGRGDVLDAANVLVTEALASTDPTLRCAAGEAVGRMAQVTDEAGFVSQTALKCFEKLKTSRDVISRTGHSLSLGCVHRYVGGIGSGQHLRTSVGILLALAQDHNSPEVQVWALHALALIVDAFGPMFRAYVEPSLQAILSLLLSVASSHVQVHRCLGRCLTALITTLGPELQGNTSSVSSARSSCLTSCFIMSNHYDAQVQAEAISCLQQLHMFAPRHVELSTLVPRLCEDLSSWHLVLRRSAVSCLRQLAQKESTEVCEIAAKTTERLAKMTKKHSNYGVKVGDTGLEGALFALLDHECDSMIMSDTRDTLNHILHSMALGRLGFWLPLCKSVLAASTDTSALGPVDPQQPENEDKDDDDDVATFTKGKKEEKSDSIPPRWSTRVFAVECVRKITTACRQPGAPPAHFDLQIARSVVRSGGEGDFLVLHLSDLVRMAFMAATDTSAQLRMAGLEALQDVIKYFKDVPEPEFPGAVILEQFQANVGAALRPAFTQSADSSHEVTARACEVCSAWLASGVVSDLNDLKRVHSLLVSSLDSMTKPSNSSGQLYSESASTMEKLAVLKAWAEVYIVAKQQAKNSSQRKVKSAQENNESLLTLVEPHLPILSSLWMKVLRDLALLRLPREFHTHMPKEGGAFFTPESMAAVRPHYAKSWTPIIHAASVWLKAEEFVKEKIQNSETSSDDEEDQKTDHNQSVSDETKAQIHLIMGVCVETLCSPRASETLEVVVACLSALNALLSTKVTRNIIGKDQMLGIELLNVIHRLLLTRENSTSQHKVMEVASKIVQAYKEELYSNKDVIEPTENAEGGVEGHLVPGKSIVFASLEVCMCVLVRQFPSINPTFRNQNPDNSKGRLINDESSKLVSMAIDLLVECLTLCSPKATSIVLPTVMVLITGALKECVISNDINEKTNCQAAYNTITTTILRVIRVMINLRFMSSEDSEAEWIKILRSSLATVLDFANEGDVKKDMGTVLMFISLFLLSAPTIICKHDEILSKIIDVFEKSFASDDTQLQLKVTQILPSIFRLTDTDLTWPFIHRMTPLVVNKLSQISESSDIQQTLAIAIECFKILDLLVILTEDDDRQDMIDIFMSVLATFLTTIDEGEKLSQTKQFKRQLHDCALQYLIQVGQKYPQAFRSILDSQMVVKMKLEEAVRANQLITQRRQQQEIKRQEQQAARQAKANAPPSIKLKMDFSNFGGK